MEKAYRTKAKKDSGGMLGTGVDWNADDILLGTSYRGSVTEDYRRGLEALYSHSHSRSLPMATGYSQGLLANAFISAKCMLLKDLLDDL